MRRSTQLYSYSNTPVQLQRHTCTATATHLYSYSNTPVQLHNPLNRRRRARSSCRPRRRPTRRGDPPTRAYTSPTTRTASCSPATAAPMAATLASWPSGRARLIDVGEGEAENVGERLRRRRAHVVDGHRPAEL